MRALLIAALIASPSLSFAAESPFDAHALAEFLSDGVAIGRQTPLQNAHWPGIDPLAALAAAPDSRAVRCAAWKERKRLGLVGPLGPYPAGLVAAMVAECHLRLAPDPVIEFKASEDDGGQSGCAAWQEEVDDLTLSSLGAPIDDPGPSSEADPVFDAKAAAELLPEGPNVHLYTPFLTGVWFDWRRTVAAGCAAGLEPPGCAIWDAEAMRLVDPRSDAGTALFQSGAECADDLEFY